MQKLTAAQAKLAGELVDDAIRRARYSNASVGKTAEVNEGTVRRIRQGFGTRKAVESVCKVLEINLEDALVTAGLAAARVHHATPDRGGYSREVFRSYVGKYIAIRPAYGKTAKIKCYQTEIAWDEKQDCLCFGEKRDDSYGHSGSIYVPPTGSYLYLMTIQQGFVRTIIVSRADSASRQVDQMRGLVLSQYNSTGAHYTPICAPIVYLRGGIEQVGEGLEGGEIGPDAPNFARYAALLHETLSKDYARIQLMSVEGPAAAALDNTSPDPTG